MTDLVVIAIVAIIPSVLITLVGLRKVANKVDEVGKSVNGRVEQLVAAAEVIARAKGNLEGRNEERLEYKTKPRRRTAK